MGINYFELGRKIRFYRNVVKGVVTQEKMAEELNLHQADISNQEAGKKGSGISDLDKLQLIADYFGISLETLIFGEVKELGNMNLVKMKCEVAR